jgi:hypothetical protein
MRCVRAPSPHFPHPRGRSRKVRGACDARGKAEREPGPSTRIAGGTEVNKVLRSEPHLPAGLVRGQDYARCVTEALGMKRVEVARAVSR